MMEILEEGCPFATMSDTPDQIATQQLSWHEEIYNRYLKNTTREEEEKIQEKEITQQTVPLCVVVSYSSNRFEYLTDALDSLVVQTYKNFEVVVVNDGIVTFKTVQQFGKKPLLSIFEYSLFL
jgi:hypothetical protein